MNLLNTIKKNCFFSVTLLLLMCSHALSAYDLNGRGGDIQPSENESAACRMAVSMISADNYKKVNINDSLSVLVFDRYLMRIDPNRSYLLASDVASFKVYRTQFDDDLLKGNLQPAFAMFNTYNRRYQDRLKYAINHLQTRISFDVKENYTPDRRKMPYVNSMAEMNRIWNQRVKYDLLELQTAKADLSKNKEILRKRYKALLEQSYKTSSQDVFQMFMDAFTASVDPHVAYFNPFNSAQFDVQASRSLEGIGATLALENEFVTIKSLTPGGPAFKTKQINVDDRIIAIGQGKNGEFEDVFGWRLDNAISLIRGAKGTIVKLKILSKGKNSSDAPQIVEVVRDKIILEDQSAKKEVRTYQANGRAVKIGIITLPSFYLDFAAQQRRESNYKSTTRDVKLLLDSLKKENIDGVMIDLRGNGGGSLTEVVSLTGLFIPSGPVVQVRDLDQHVQVNRDRDTTVTYGGPLAVLIDRMSASASEIFAAAIQDYGRGIILGATSYGKGTVQAQVNMDTQGESLSGLKVTAERGNSLRTFGQVNITIGKFYRINGSSTQHKGVSPDIEMPSFITSSTFGEDTELSAMAWDTIAKTPYAKTGSISKVLPILKGIYQQRSQKSAAFKAYNSLIDSYHKNLTINAVSLDEQEFKRIRDKNEDKALSQSNQLRVAMGLPVLKRGEARPKTDDLDYLRMEAGQILTDYIVLNQAAEVL